MQQESSRALGLYDDPGELLNPLDQGAFFSAVAAGNVDGVVALLKHRKLDINEYNGQGVTAIFVAVYNFESSRSVSMAKLLIDHGAKVTMQAVDSPAASKLCYLKHDSPPSARSGSPGSSGIPTSPGSPRSPRSPRGMAAGRKDETRKVSVANKTPLLFTVRAVDSPAASKLCYLKHDSPPSARSGSPASSGSPGSPRSPRSPRGLAGRKDESRKVAVANKTPLLVALELKSSLYLKGWDYRHWDAMLDLLADATVAELAGRPFHGPGPVQLPAVVDGWAAVFGSGGHELVEVWAEGKHIDVLKMLLVVQSKSGLAGDHRCLVQRGQVSRGVSSVWHLFHPPLLPTHTQRFKFELEKAAAVSPGRLEITDASFNVVKAVMEFLYTGHVSREFMGHRGVDLLLAAHKYEVFGLQKLCEEQLEPTPESWIKMLTAALECGADALVLKVARSIHAVMNTRHATRLFVKQPFSASFHPEGGPAQLPLIDDAGVEEVEVKTL
ncbi:unnamed protein product [Closterium sp. NIES-54]